MELTCGSIASPLTLRASKHGSQLWGPQKAQSLFQSWGLAHRPRVSYFASLSLQALPSILTVSGMILHNLFPGDLDCHSLQWESGTGNTEISLFYSNYVIAIASWTKELLPSPQSKWIYGPWSCDLRLINKSRGQRNRLCLTLKAILDSSSQSMAPLCHSPPLKDGWFLIGYQIK